MTSLRPDQTSSTAQTLTSTKPRGSAWRRMSSSPISLGTPEERFGHDTQIMPSRAICRIAAGSVSANSRSERVKQVPEIDVRAKAGRDRHAVRVVDADQSSVRRRVVLGPNPETRLDAELLRQWRARVAWHLTWFLAGQRPRPPLRSVPLQVAFPADHDQTYDSRNSRADRFASAT